MHLCKNDVSFSAQYNSYRWAIFLGLIYRSNYWRLSVRRIPQASDVSTLRKYTGTYTLGYCYPNGDLCNRLICKKKLEITSLYLYCQNHESNMYLLSTYGNHNFNIVKPLAPYPLHISFTLSTITHHQIYYNFT